MTSPLAAAAANQTARLQLPSTARRPVLVLIKTRRLSELQITQSTTPLDLISRKNVVPID
jgi:hypothetical protein